MKLPDYFDIKVLKFLIVLSMICLNSSVTYGQDLMEDAKISLSFSEEDDAKTITATATDNEGLPIEELDLYFYVTRTFSLLRIGDRFNTTDENGQVVVEFPKDLPGDTEGNVTLVVKIFESDLYNDLEVKATKKWGIPVEKIDYSVEKRSLWAAAANAPITLVLIVSGLILAIWSIICYIIFILFKISKIKPV